MDAPPFLVEFDLRRRQGRLRRVGCVRHLKQLCSPSISSRCSFDFVSRAFLGSARSTFGGDKYPLLGTREDLAPTTFRTALTDSASVVMWRFTCTARWMKQLSRKGRKWRNEANAMAVRCGLSAVGGGADAVKRQKLQIHHVGSLPKRRFKTTMTSTPARQTRTKRALEEMEEEAAGQVTDALCMRRFGAHHRRI